MSEALHFQSQTPPNPRLKAKLSICHVYCTLSLFFSFSNFLIVINLQRQCINQLMIKTSLTTIMSFNQFAMAVHETVDVEGCKTIPTNIMCSNEFALTVHEPVGVESCIISALVAPYGQAFHRFQKLSGSSNCLLVHLFTSSEGEEQTRMRRDKRLTK